MIRILIFSVILLDSEACGQPLLDFRFGHALPFLKRLISRRLQDTPSLTTYEMPFNLKG